MQPFILLIFRVTSCFFLFSWRVCVCNSLLWLQKEAGSSDPRALPAVPLSGWLFIAFLSLNCRSVESFATTFWGQNPEMFTDRQNLSELEMFFCLNRSIYENNKKSLKLFLSSFNVPFILLSSKFSEEKTCYFPALLEQSLNPCLPVQGA